MDPEELTQQTYEKIAVPWTQRHGQSDFWLPEFKKFQKLLPAGKIIDIGCGPGRDYALFHEAGYEYVDIDASPAILAEANKRNPHGTFQVMNMQSLNFPAQSFDGFWAIASLLHIPKKDAVNVLKEITRIIKKEGIGLITVKEGAGEKIVDSGFFEGDQRFFAFYQDHEFKNILGNAGFEILKSEKKVHTSKEAIVTPWLAYYVWVK